MGLILAGFAVIALVDMVPLVSNHSSRGTLAFLLIFTPALALAVLQVNKVDIPSVLLLLGNLLKMVGISYG